MNVVEISIRKERKNHLMQSQPQKDFRATRADNSSPSSPTPSSDTTKVIVHVDRDKLIPFDPVPMRLRHKFFFQLALLYLGEKGTEIPKQELRDRALIHLKFVSVKFFDNSSWDETLVRSLTAALEAVEGGKNNLHRCQQFDEGPFEIRV